MNLFAYAYIHATTMQQLLQMYLVKQTANTYAYIVCRTEHVYAIFIAIKNLVCFPVHT